ncbi:Chondroitin proteoglycan 2 [Amphibalanus amphitrite]|uniref:Chondroitin proteoglycan 2 n=1 Tax=Amphibalanus amphitrite TaxID=1232801 RepID=A0A6A4VJQ2_AMPAM|nr:Chondroitin proteoglycan 2 [Amphibalanus amphitrite]
MNCPANLEFNPTLLVCDWPEHAGCGGKTTLKPTTAKPTTPKPGPDFDCPSDGLFPNPADCHTFYHCSNGHAYLKDCPANLEFNPNLLVCDWPENAGCGGKTTRPPKPTSGPTPKPTPNPDIICPNETCVCRVPDSTDCNKYYQCKDGKAYPDSCPAGLVFNPATEVCDLAENVPGCKPTTPRPTTQRPTTKPPAPAPTQPAPSDFDCPTDNGLFPNPADCHTFYHCSNGHAYLKDCPANLEFNPTLLVCDWPEDAGCGGKPTPPPKPTSSPTPKPTPNPDVICPNDTCACRVPDSTDCNKFYQCKDGKAFPDSCPGGLVFNPATEVCDFAENVPACRPTAPSPTTPKPTTPKPTTPKPTTKPTPKPTKPPKPDSESSEESGSGSDSSDSDSDESGSKSKHSGSKSKHSGSKSKHSGSKSKKSGSKSKHSGSKSKHSGSKSKHSGSKSKHSGSKSKHHDSKSKHHDSKSKHSGSKSQHLKRSAEPVQSSAPANSRLYRNPDQGRIEDDDGFLEAQFCPRPTGKFPSSRCHYYYHCVDGVPTLKRCLHGTRFYAPDQRCILGSC